MDGVLERAHPHPLPPPQVSQTTPRFSVAEAESERQKAMIRCIAQGVRDSDD